MGKQAPRLHSTTGRRHGGARLVSKIDAKLQDARATPELSMLAL